MTILEYIWLLRGRDFVAVPQQDLRPEQIEKGIDSAFQWRAHIGMRSSAILNTLIFRSGDCWRFALLIKAMFPEAKAHLCWKAKEQFGHVIVEYQDKFYDITGEMDMDGWEIDERDLSEQTLRNFSGFELTTATTVLDNFYYSPQERKALKSSPAHASIAAIKLVDGWNRRLQREGNEFADKFNELLDTGGGYQPYDACASRTKDMSYAENKNDSDHTDSDLSDLTVDTDSTPVESPR